MTEVFISFKNSYEGQATRDSVMAKELYEQLSCEGMDVFFSNESLRETGGDEFGDIIDAALDAAKILVLVATKKEFVDSKWVKYEWRNLFLNEILSGRKPDGKLFTYLEGMSASDLPIALRGRQSFSRVTDTLPKIAEYIKNALGKGTPAARAQDLETTKPHGPTVLGVGKTSIDDEEFEGRNDLKSVRIADSVTSIGWFAFNGCSSLTSVAIPAGVTSIGTGAFSGCDKLREIHFGGTEKQWGELTKENIGLSKEYIGLSSDAVIHCRESYKRQEAQKNVGPTEKRQEVKKSVSSTVKRKEVKKSVSSTEKRQEMKKSVGSAVTVYVLRDGRTTSDGREIKNRNDLVSVILADGVTGIGQDAFRDCRNLASVTLPDSLTSIGHGAFFGCSSLTSITIPSSVTSIGNSVFYGCSGLTSITLLGSVSIGFQAFAYCSSLEKITVKGGYIDKSEGNCLIDTMRKTLVLGCKTSKVPDGVEFIGRSAFFGCSGLTSITIPNSVKSIDYNAFSGCTALEHVYYRGDKSAWKRVGIGDDNKPLKKATIHFDTP